MFYAHKIMLTKVQKETMKKASSTDLHLLTFPTMHSEMFRKKKKEEEKNILRKSNLVYWNFFKKQNQGVFLKEETKGYSQIK